MTSMIDNGMIAKQWEENWRGNMAAHWINSMALWMPISSSTRPFSPNGTSSYPSKGKFNSLSLIHHIRQARDTGTHLLNQRILVIIKPATATFRKTGRFHLVWLALLEPILSELDTKTVVRITPSTSARRKALLSMPSLRFPSDMSVASSHTL